MILFALAMVAAPGPVAPAPPKEEWLHGRVEQVGTAQLPSLNLVTDEGKRYEVVGALVPELARCQGCKLQISVERQNEGSMLPRMRALQYKIDEVGGGDKPEVGIVKVNGDKVSIVVDKDKTLTLADTQVAHKVKDKSGSKVWVVGKASSNGFKAWRVGFLVPAAAADSTEKEKDTQ